jgi:GT2 family glycosyltransferase
MTSGIDVSIIIVNYNACKLLLQCINSIAKYETKIKNEIIVVDNKSSDGSIETVAYQFPFVRLVPLEKNVGFAAANNVGIQYSRGEYILFLNPDTILLEPTLESLIIFFQKHEMASIVGCKILNSDRSFQRSFFPFTSLTYVFWVTSLLEKIFPITRTNNRWRIGNIQPNKPVQVDRLLGAFMLLKKQTIKEVGFFDEIFFMYSEEEDLCYRVKNSGGEIWYVPSVSIIHHGGQSTQHNYSDSIIQANLSKFYFVRINNKLTSRIIYSIIWSVGFFLRISVLIFATTAKRSIFFKGYWKSFSKMFQILFSDQG